MFARLQKAFALLALASLLGGHWAILQSIAWTKMLIDRSSERSAIEAIVSTFSGDEPCEICLAIQEGKSNEKQDPSTQIILKQPLLTLIPKIHFVPRTPPLIATLSTHTIVLPSSRPTPPTPPPRHLA